MSAEAVSPRRPLRVLLADDHRLFVEALQAVIGADGRMVVAGYARNGEEAVELARRLRPDVILMDIAMPILDGVEATRRINAELAGVGVLILTGSNSPADVQRAREAGAAGYVTKDRIAAELIDAILGVGST